MPLNIDTQNELSDTILRNLLETMVRIRKFEETIVDVYGQQDMKSPVHLCLGQEAVAVGVCAHLQKNDYIFTTHRSHGHCLAKGIEPREFYAEFYGRAAGCSHGKGGSMHPADPEFGILGTSAIVGGGIPLAVGTALSSAMKKDGRVSVTFFGDGAAEEGTFHESLNFAALKKLPVIFLCENNYYAVASPLSQRQSCNDIAKKAEGYGIPGFSVDGNDVLGVYDVALEAVNRARQGEGPTLIECKTYRWKGHVGPECDCERGCRPKDELNSWIAKCPVTLFKNYLVDKGIISEVEYSAMVDEISALMKDAQEKAKDSPMPGTEQIYSHVYYSRETNALD